MFNAKVMFHRVPPEWHQFEVFKSIVETITVYVVNDLRGIELSA